MASKVTDMKIRFAHSINRKPLGFSLFELLTTIMILGIMLALVVPSMNTANAADEARSRRNAQELSSLCMVAQAAGLNFVVAGDLGATIDKILQGGSPTSGIFMNRRFSVQGISSQEARTSMKYLRLEGGALIYSPTAHTNAVVTSTSELVYRMA